MGDLEPHTVASARARAQAAGGRTGPQGRGGCARPDPQTGRSGPSPEGLGAAHGGLGYEVVNGAGLSA